MANEQKTKAEQWAQWEQEEKDRLARLRKRANATAGKLPYRISNAGGDGNTVEITRKLTASEYLCLQKIAQALNDAKSASIWTPFLYIGEVKEK